MIPCGLASDNKSKEYKNNNKNCVILYMALNKKSSKNLSKLKSNNRKSKLLIFDSLSSKRHIKNNILINYVLIFFLNIFC